MFAGRHLENGRILKEYGVRRESTMHLVFRFHGGMYHFTSGRHDFNSLPPESATAIQNALAFRLKDANDLKQLTTAQLQNSILEAQDILLPLLHNSKNLYTADNLPCLKNILAPIVNDNEDNDIDEDSGDE